MNKNLIKKAWLEKFPFFCLSGKDNKRFLNGITTSNILLESNNIVKTCWLDPKGILLSPVTEIPFPALLHKFSNALSCGSRQIFWISWMVWRFSAMKRGRNSWDRRDCTLLLSLKAALLKPFCTTKASTH